MRILPQKSIAVGMMLSFIIISLVAIILRGVGKAHSAADSAAAALAAESWLQENADAAIAARALLTEKDKNESVLAQWNCTFDWSLRKKVCPKE